MPPSFRLLPLIKLGEGDKGNKASPKAVRVNRLSVTYLSELVNQARGVKVIQRARHSLMKIDKRRRIMPWENEEDCR